MLQTSRRIFCATLVCGASTLFAGGKSSAPATPPEVTAALIAEARTENDAVDRRAALEPVRTARDSREAWWQSGFVRHGEAWQPLEDVRPADVDLLQNYQIRRAAAGNSAADQLKLADWCRDKGLRDQERVHLGLALKSGEVSHPDVILRRLGYRPVGNQWYTEDELRASSEVLARLGKEWKRISPRLGSLASRLEGKPAQRARALSDLRSLLTADAIPLLEWTLGAHSEVAANALVECLAELGSYRASQSLARLAIGSPWDSVQRAATVELKRRPWEEFVPSALTLMEMPAKLTLLASESAVRNPAPGSTSEWRFIWSREGRNAVEVAVQRLFVLRGEPMVIRTRLQRFQTAQSQAAAQSEMLNRVAELAVFDAAYDAVRGAEESNDRVERLNQAVAQLLRAVTDETINDAPDAWWDWWDRTITDTVAEGPKTTFIVEETSQTVFLPQVAVVPSASCLAAGTPVWTETGFVSIEKIQVGDRVLSKNIETGELCYQPVFQTTRRANAALSKLVVGDETIFASPGHNFWISGRGWTRTNQLQSGLRAHTATGAVCIEIEETGTTADVFNLVVADFHTYFVGRSRLLGHDVLPPAPTDLKVPGLPFNPAVAK